MVEDEPVKSMYHFGKSGRISSKKMHLYPPGGSLTLLAHKGPCICNGGGARSREGTDAREARRVKAPRTSELDRVGCVVMESWPAKGTYLADAVAELLIKR